MLGGWLLGTVLIWWIASTNFSMVEQVLAAVEKIEKAAGPLEEDQLRPLFRHLAAELNRYFFHHWAVLQIVLAVLLLAIVAPGSHQGKKYDLLLVSLMGGIVIAFAAYVTPEMVREGEKLDFALGEAAARRRFGILHGLYVGLDIFKLLLGLVLSWRLWRRTSGVGA